MPENVKPGQSTRRPDSGKRHPSVPPRPQETKAPDNSQKIKEFIKKLEKIYDVVEATEAPFLDPAEYGNLSIDCQELRLNSDGSYASPRPQPCFFNASFPNVMNHRIEFKKEGDDDQRHYENTGRKLKRCMDEPNADYTSADILCNILEWEFRGYPRRGIKNNLASHSDWRPSDDFREDGVFNRVFWDELFYPSKVRYMPVAAFVPRSRNRPHLMFCMKYNIKEDDKLLRGEFLAIVAAIITRLQRFSSGGHLYIPVLVFSFMGLLQGRILQAYYDGSAVVIRKTKLYHFCPENAKDLTSLFMQQMSSTPMGPTKEMSWADSKKATQGASQDLSLRQRPSNTR